MQATHDQEHPTTRVMYLAVGLSFLAALSYLLMDWGILGVGDLAAAERPSGIVYAAAGGYVLGGLLILLRRRWLWIVGLIINGLVIMAFVNFYLARPAVLFSPGGLASKSAQIALEVALLYLIFSDWAGAHRQAR